MKINQLPKVAVLLAAYNGEKYIKEQILSILNQKYVEIHIFISIDQSTDLTLKICKELQYQHNNITIINKGTEKFGSAGKNFYYLFKAVNLDGFDFIALSDQDDIWKENKLNRGVEVLKSQNCDGYSSDVECFWESGRKNKIIKKSYPQRKYDYLFEPAGPGCTYVLKNNLAIAIKNNINSSPQLPFHHDWFIYAFSRANGYKWHIDQTSNILYRQHNNNQEGANYGIKQKIKRLKKLKTGEYKSYINEILKSTKSPFARTLKTKIIKNPFLFRRKKTEAFFLFLFALINWI